VIKKITVGLRMVGHAELIQARIWRRYGWRIQNRKPLPLSPRIPATIIPDRVPAVLYTPRQQRVGRNALLLIDAYVP
jgi:hypothetical protein